MNVIFTGQPGVQKIKLLDNLIEAIRLSHGNLDKKTIKRGKILNIYSVEREIADNPIGFKTFIETEDPERIEELWAKGFDSVLKSVDDDGYNNNFLSMHAVCRKFGEFFSPINWVKIQQFQPDLFITLIDDIYDIWWRLRENKEIQQSEQFELREIIDWRALEIMIVDMLADFLMPKKEIPHYIVGIKHPASMLAKLILEPETMRIYSAYPISGVRNDKKAIEIIDQHKKQLHDKFVVFDPNAIDEMLLINKHKEWELLEPDKRGTTINIDLRKERWKMKSNVLNLPQLSDGVKTPKKIKFDSREIEDVEKTIRHQVASRDYRLIDQGNIMTAYRPVYKGKPSIGVIREISYANLKRKIPYQYWEPEDGGPDHPFLARGNFSFDYEDYLSRLDRHQEQLLLSGDELSHEAQFMG